MKKFFGVCFVLSIGVAIMGLYNSFNFIARGGAGPFESWVYGLGPFLGGGLLSVFFLWLYGRILERRCPACGHRFVVFLRGSQPICGGLNVRCECGKLLWLPVIEEPVTVPEPQ